MTPSASRWCASSWLARGRGAARLRQRCGDPRGCDDAQPHRQRYRCKACAGRFDDLTGTALAGHHRPLRVWVLCLYFMGLNLSNRQITLELGLSPIRRAGDDGTCRRGLVAKVPAARLEGKVEVDEVYVVAGHKGQPGAVAKRGGSGRRRRLAGAPGRGTLEKDKPPILGLIQRGGGVFVHMLANVQRTTIQPIITATVAKGALIHTNEYGIYARLPAWGYQHKTVCHGRGEYARDEDGDGFCEVHINTIEGFWSLLRSWLRPRRGYIRRSCRSIWGSSSSCTTHAVAAKPCLARSSPPSWRRADPTPRKPTRACLVWLHSDAQPGHH